MFSQLSSSTTVLQFTVVFLCIGLLISSFEYLFNYKLFSSEGLLDWRIIRIRWKSGLLKKILNYIVKQNILNTLLVVRVLFLFVLLAVPVLSTLFWVSAIVIFLTYAIITQISFYGSDGSDQMAGIILVTICLCASPFTTENLIFIGFLFIALQSCLAYFIAGFSKLLSKAWRSGEAVQDIFRTRTYGSEKIYRYIRHKRGINLFLCWSVIIAEMLFPLVLFLPINWGVGFLIWGIVFHLLNSFIMGLNTFFWAFLASYPAIIYVNRYWIN